MGFNVDQFREGLRDYHDTLAKHTSQLREDLESLRELWSRLSTEYEGSKADELKQAWNSTQQWIEEYTWHTARLAELLDEKIGHLEHV